MSASEAAAPSVSSANHECFREFVDSCKSPVTRNSYTKVLHYFMDYLRIPRDNYSKLLEKDPKLIQMDIRDFIKFKN
jgi:hypothetical protein